MTIVADGDGDGLINGLEIALGLNELTGDGDCDGVSDAIEYGFANLPSDPMSPAAACADARLTAVHRAVTQSVTVTLRNPVGPATLPVGTTVRIHFVAPAQPPPISKSSGGPQCTSIAAVGFDSAYECTLASALAPGANAAVSFVFTAVGGPLFQPGANNALILPIPGLTDPVSVNNSASF